MSSGEREYSAKALPAVGQAYNEWEHLSSACFAYIRFQGVVVWRILARFISYQRPSCGDTYVTACFFFIW